MGLKTSASFFLLLLSLFLCELSVSSTSIHDLLPSGPISSSAGLAAFRQRSGCSDHGCGVVAAEDVEFQLDSEINRRLLAGTHIRTPVLDPNKPICHTKDGKAYNCLPPLNSDRGKRGCTGYYRCGNSPAPAG